MTILNKSYKNNIWKTWIIMWVNQDYLLFWISVIYMIFMGLNLIEISTVISSWLIISSIWQIPWWVFADKFWYKTSIIIWLILTIFWMSIFAFSNWFFMFALWYSINWFWAAMIWWADQALVYESLLEKNKEKDFKKIISKISFYMNFSALFLCALWWLFYSYFSPQIPFIIQIFINIVWLFLAISLKPTKIQKQNKTIILQIKESFKYAFTKKDFSKIFIFSAIIWSISITTNQFLQPFYKSIEIDEKFFWILASLSFLFWWLGSLFSTKLWKIFSIDHYLVLHASVFSLLLLILTKFSNIPIIVIIISALFFLRWLYVPTISTYINEKVSSDKRATMLSINSQFLYITSSFSLFWIWYLAENYWLHTAFFWISILSLIFLILYILNLREVKTK